MVQVQVHCPHIYPFSVPGASCHMAAKFNYYSKKKVEKLRLMCGIYSKLLCTIKVAALLYFFSAIFSSVIMRSNLPTCQPHVCLFLIIQSSKGQYEL